MHVNGQGELGIFNFCLPRAAIENEMSVVHKYYCHFCRIHIYGVTPERLAFCVNEHNDNHHPDECLIWTGLSIKLSLHYSAPTPTLDSPIAPSRILPQYTTSHGTTSKNEWGNAISPPDITKDDIEMLAKGRVKW
jgi:hypothetical protein